MMHKKFLISDTHFGHEGILKMRGLDNQLIRPEFKTVEEMDETMVENWNKTVRQVDKVYHMGDVVMNRRCLKILERLNGKKVLYKGNHDIFKLKDYAPYFYDIRAHGYLPKYGFIISHIPIHPSQFFRFTLNLHGHLHEKIINDRRYLNLCVERNNYTPIDLDKIVEEYND